MTLNALVLFLIKLAHLRYKEKDEKGIEINGEHGYTCGGFISMFGKTSTCIPVADLF